jgi:hypothetical protein
MKSVNKQEKSSIWDTELGPYRKIRLYERAPVVWCILSERVDQIGHECHGYRFMVIFKWLISDFIRLIISKYQRFEKIEWHFSLLGYLQTVWKCRYHPTCIRLRQI